MRMMRRLLAVGRFHLIGRLQSFDHRFDALGKALRIEIQRIVVAVRDIGVERGVVGRNEPVLRPQPSVARPIRFSNLVSRQRAGEIRRLLRPRNTTGLRCST